MSNRAQILITAIDQTRSAFDSIKANLRGLTDHAQSVNGLLSNLGVALTGAGFAALIKGSIDAADELDELSQKAGISVEALSTLKLAAQHENVGAEAFATSLKKLAGAMFEAAAGSEDNKRLFAALGIQYRDSNGALRATDQVLLDLASRFKDMPDGPEKSAIAVKLFGKTGTDLIPFLNHGADGVQELTERFRELGGEIDGDTATRAADFNDDLNLLHASLKGMANRIAADVLPGLSDLAQGMVESSRTGGSLRAILDGIVYALKILTLGATVTANGFIALGETMGAGVAAGVLALKGQIGQAKTVLADLENNLTARRDRMLQLNDSLFNPKPAMVKTPTIQSSPNRDSVATRLAQSANTKDTSSARLALVKANAEAEFRIIADGLKRAQTAYDQALEDNLISIRDFYATRTRLSKAAIDAEITARRQEMAEQSRLATSSKDESTRLRARADIKKLEADIRLLDNQRTDTAIDDTRKAAKAEQELAKELANVRSRLAELAGGMGGEITRDNLTREYQPLLDKLKATGNTQGQNDVLHLIDVQSDLAELAKLEAAFNATMEHMRIAEAELKVQRDAGLLTESQLRQKLLTLHHQTAQTVDGMIPKMETLSQVSGSEDAINRVARLRVEVRGLATEADEVAQRIDGSLQDGLAQMFESVGSGAKSAKEAFSDFARSVLQDLQKIASRRLADGIFGNIASGGSGGSSGSIGSFIASIFGNMGGAGFAHGGYVDGPGTSTSDSIPARLSAGEYVINAAAVRGVGVSFLNALNGVSRGPRLQQGRLGFADGGLVEALKPSAPAANSSVRIVNVIDPAMAQDYLQSSAGERTILNILARNGSAVRQILG